MWTSATTGCVLPVWSGEWPSRLQPTSGSYSSPVWFTGRPWHRASTSTWYTSSSATSSWPTFPLSSSASSFWLSSWSGIPQARQTAGPSSLKPLWWTTLSMPPLSTCQVWPLPPSLSPTSFFTLVCLMASGPSSYCSQSWPWCSVATTWASSCICSGRGARAWSSSRSLSWLSHSPTGVCSSTSTRSRRAGTFTLLLWL